MTNCKNCGAVLRNSKCDYCKTEYPIIAERIIDPAALARYDLREPRGLKRITQEEYDTMFRHYTFDNTVKRGSTYSSAYASAFIELMYKSFDLSDVDVYQCITVKDPINSINITVDGTIYEVQKPVGFWQRIFKNMKGG